MYQLDALYRKVPIDSPLTEAQLQAAPPHLLEGEVDDVVFVSVPITTSQHSAETLRETLRVAFGDKKLVVIITHNIELLRAQRLSTKKGSEYLKNIEDVAGSGLRDAIYERLRVVLNNYRSDIDQAMDGEEPKCMRSPTDMATWAMEFLVSMRRVIDAAEGEEDAGEDAIYGSTPDTDNNRH